MHTAAHPSHRQEPGLFADHTPARSRQTPDLFANHPAPPAHLLQFAGVLLRNAEVRNKPALDGLHSVPVVCMELKSTSTPTRTCHAEQPFTAATRPQAEALARLLKKGRCVTVRTPATAISLIFPHVESVQLTEESAP